MTPPASHIPEAAIARAVGDIVANLQCAIGEQMTDGDWILIIRKAVLKGALLATDHAAMLVQNSGMRL